MSSQQHTFLGFFKNLGESATDFHQSLVYESFFLGEKSYRPHRHLILYKSTSTHYTVGEPHVDSVKVLSPICMMTAKASADVATEKKRKKNTETLTTETCDV